MMPALPPLQMAATSGAHGGDLGAGSKSAGITSGDWNINQGSGSQGMGSKWMMIAACAAALFCLKKLA